LPAVRIPCAQLRAGVEPMQGFTRKQVATVGLRRRRKRLRRNAAFLSAVGALSAWVQARYRPVLCIAVEPARRRRLARVAAVRTFFSVTLASLVCDGL